MSITYNFSKNNSLLVLSKDGTHFALTVDQFFEIQQIVSEVKEGKGNHYASDSRIRSNQTTQFTNDFVQKVQHRDWLENQ